LFFRKSAAEVNVLLHLELTNEMELLKIKGCRVLMGVNLTLTIVKQLIREKKPSVEKSGHEGHGP
jgi:hypothetical protein